MLAIHTPVALSVKVQLCLLLQAAFLHLCADTGVPQRKTCKMQTAGQT